MSQEEIKNNKMASIGGFLRWLHREDIQLEIPMYQRNYVWDKGTAKTLLQDLWGAFQQKKEIYTLGMLSLSQKKDKSEQEIPAHFLLVDGQQRCITLSMLFGFLENYPREGQGENHFHLLFARDQGCLPDKTRLAFLLQNHQTEKKVQSLDQQRFFENLMGMKETWAELLGSAPFESPVTPESVEDFHLRQDLAQYIKKHCQILFHCTELEALNEFLNINNNKTRFAVSDHIKALLMIETAQETEKLDKRMELRGLFQDLSCFFYHKDQEALQEMLMAGHKKWEEQGSPYKGCNRLSILYLDRKNPMNENNYRNMYHYHKEKERLFYLRSLMMEVSQDLNTGDSASYFVFLGCLAKRTSWVALVDVLDNKEGNPAVMPCLEEHYLDFWKKLSAKEKQVFIASLELTSKEELSLFLESLTERNLQGIPEIPATISPKTQEEEWILQQSLAENLQWFEEIYQQYIQEKQEQRRNKEVLHGS